MFKQSVFALAAAGMLAACGANAEATSEAEETAKAGDGMSEVLAADLRSDDKARDEYRNPGETLAFFQIEPDQTVIEYAPGGGWYTRVLAPYLADAGQYIGVGFAPEAAAALGDEFVERVRAGGETFSDKQSEALGIPAEKLPFYFGNAIPE
ncbi:MAG: hypothetical protein AAF707_04075, partial [Pseudomonadota bacterium]